MIFTFWKAKKKTKRDSLTLEDWKSRIYTSVKNINTPEALFVRKLNDWTRK